MGLAASQTSCEYKSTEIAQQKLEITNQLSDISVDYANAMNATKLIWNNEAATYDYGVNYGLLMTPSAMNNYNAYMVTTNSGAIVLNAAYASAAKAAGISKAGGIGSQDSRDKFIAALVPEGIITQDSANAITLTDRQFDKNGKFTEITNTDKTQNNGIVKNDSSVAWNPVTGMGAIPMDKESVDMMDLSAMILSESIGQQTVDWDQLFLPIQQAANPSKKLITQSEYDRVITNYDKQIGEKQAALEAADAASKPAIRDELNKLKTEKKDYEKNNKENIMPAVTNPFNTGNSLNAQFSIISGSTIKNEDIKDMTLGEILASNVVLIKGTNDTKAFTESAMKLLESFANILGYDRPTGTGLNVDESAQKALEFAFNMTKHMYEFGSIVKGSGGTNTSSMVNNNRIGSNGTQTAISLTNMMSSFLTYYDNYLRGNDSPYYVGQSLDTTNYVTDDSSYMYVGRSTNNEVTRSQKLADFFDQIYNNICEHGWREDAAIEDGEYFESMLKNSRYCLSSLNNDGYYYQTRYNETGYMVEVSDEDAIARAEAEFTQKKAELTYKEDSIDMKSKKLDAEISMLSNEYEAVKNLISKSIEKTFTMFSN